MRLNKYLRDHYDISRRKADTWIARNLIKINGKTVTELGVLVGETDFVEVEAEALLEKETFKYFLLNKPIGYTCTKSTQEGKTIFDLLPKLEGLSYSGRLDKDSHGLIIVSNDGNFVYKMASREHEKFKVYRVKLNGIITDFDLEIMANGMLIDGKMTKKCTITRLSPVSYEITLNEGMNRQIRKMAAILGYKVLDLGRIEIHGIKMAYLGRGDYRELTEEEIKSVD